LKIHHALKETSYPTDPRSMAGFGRNSDNYRQLSFGVLRVHPWLKCLRLSGHGWFSILDKVPAAVQHPSRRFSHVTNTVWFGQMLLK
jgi:hypothetical protein